MTNIKKLQIRGFQRTSLIDYPCNVVSTIFLFGCNLRCGFCHNPELVQERGLSIISEDKVIEELRDHSKFIDGVCITGGEPLLHDLEDFLVRLKGLFLKVKIDTNGSFPEKLKELIDKKLVDYVAMDVKLPFVEYSKLGSVDVSKIKESVSVLKNSSIDYEFRTTVVSSLLNKDKLLEIARSLEGAKKLILQQFVSSDKVLDSAFSDLQSYTTEDLQGFAKECNKFVPTEVRL